MKLQYLIRKLVKRPKREMLRFCIHLCLISSVNLPLLFPAAVAVVMRLQQPWRGRGWRARRHKKRGAVVADVFVRRRSSNPK